MLLWLDSQQGFLTHAGSKGNLPLQPAGGEQAVEASRTSGQHGAGSPSPVLPQHLGQTKVLTDPRVLLLGLFIICSEKEI